MEEELPRPSLPLEEDGGPPARPAAVGVSRRPTPASRAPRRPHTGSARLRPAPCAPWWESSAGPSPPSLTPQRAARCSGVSDCTTWTELHGKPRVCARPAQPSEGAPSPARSRAPQGSDGQPDRRDAHGQPPTPPRPWAPPHLLPTTRRPQPHGSPPPTRPLLCPAPHSTPHKLYLPHGPGPSPPSPPSQQTRGFPGPPSRDTEARFRTPGASPQEPLTPTRLLHPRHQQGLGGLARARPQLRERGGALC